MSHASKTVLKILTCRLESTAELYLGKYQFGFRKGRGTRDAFAHCTYCMKGIWNTIIKSMSATLKKLLIV